MIVLDLSGIKLTIEAARAIAELSRLEELTLDDSGVDDDALACLQSLTRLRILSLANSRITDTGMKSLAALTDLESLDVRGARITGSGLVHLAGLSRLDTLSLDGTLLRDENYFNRVSDLPTEPFEVWKVDFPPGASVDDTAVPMLSHLSNLRELWIQCPKFPVQSLRDLGAWSRLRVLNAWTAPTDPDSAVDFLTDLDVIYLGGTQVTERGIARLHEALPNCTIFSNFNPAP